MLVPYSYLLLLGLPFINANPTKHADLVQCLTACKVPQFLPSTSNFTYWIQPFNMRLQYTPVALAVPSTVPQVQAAVACASKLGISVNPRSGGHNYASHDIGGEDGHFVIDLKMFQNVTVDPTTQIASVGPGIRLGNMALALYAQGKRAISHGVCPGVGIGGHATHGGWGLFSRTYGLAVDFLVEATVVVADGSVVTTSVNKNPDLFWAIRGAGSSFGVVTEFKFKTIAAPEVNYLYYYAYIWTPEQMKAGFAAFQNYANSTAMPREMNMRVFIARFAPTNSPIWLLEGIYVGDEAAFQAAAKPLLDVLGPPALHFNGTMGWIDALLYSNNNDLIPQAASHEPLEKPVDYHEQNKFFSKSLVSDLISTEAISAFVDYTYRIMLPLTSRNWFVIITAEGGPTSAVAAVPFKSTSFALRKGLLTYEFMDSIFSPFVATTDYPNNETFYLNNYVKTITESMNGTKFGAYYGYADPSLSNNEAHQMYWGDHYAKLQGIKNKWDPKKVFQNPQAVLP